MELVGEGLAGSQDPAGDAEDPLFAAGSLEDVLSAAGDEKLSLVGLSRSQLCVLLAQLAVPSRQLAMRADQLWNWIYVRGVTDFARMTSIGAALRARLEERFTLARPRVVGWKLSLDGTRKWLLRSRALVRGRKITADFECVFIPEGGRGALCLSSQAGCALSCAFCYTGTQKLLRHLVPGEIVGQILVARDELGEWPGQKRPPGVDLPEAERAVTNLVLMGMGEPLHNFEQTRDAILIAIDTGGLDFSKRRVTLSTSGIVPKIAKWGAETGTMLAISLHATRDELRDVLVPINKKYPIRSLLSACRAYPGLCNARRITFEYVMLDGVNDRPEDAKALVRLLAGIPAKINLIPFNPWPGSTYVRSSPERIRLFADILNAAGYASPVRATRGEDIMAACGQLRTDLEKNEK